MYDRYDDHTVRECLQNYIHDLLDEFWAKETTPLKVGHTIHCRICGLGRFVQSNVGINTVVDLQSIDRGE